LCVDNGALCSILQFKFLCCYSKSHSKCSSQLQTYHKWSCKNNKQLICQVILAHWVPLCFLLQYSEPSYILTAYALQKWWYPLVDFPLVLSFSSRTVEEIGVAEGCLSNTLDIVAIYAAIMVYKVQIILHNVLAINEKNTYKTHNPQNQMSSVMLVKHVPLPIYLHVFYIKLTVTKHNKSYTG